MALSALNPSLRRIPVWTLWLAGLAPAVWLFWLALSGSLGVEPIKELEHRYGELALQFFIATLAVTPLRRFVGLNLLKFRQALGLLTFSYVLCHLLVWLLLDVQIPSQIIADILKRPYITVGMAAFVLLIPLAVTSNKASIRKLGSTWRRLHKLSYPAAVLAALHFVLLAKGFQIEPLLYLGGIIVLLLLRLKLPGRIRAPDRIRRRFGAADSAR
ncbi:protein-methionine-sulfoxide reductase heme-binding subunit MsrQ [Tritonibacter horizontis]|uniref:Protein-methionine-sulfoxide reductase heme-binding subunit MsrQ n=1 Tax=Tritonibacter horizontis TaxID=1768241 RepID=A0A132BWM1_9RHOB|nr:protein-methionine-sulfoxide reductase heme-binding subunit MsrQ [Tritonibacter horizontis]KUP92783.1 sulfoxide reductase heme-binding subunit YedZ [Tritonibacter horizontis]